MADAPVTPPPAPAQEENTGFDISEEYGTARKSLPPAGVVAICVALVGIVVAIYGFTHRSKPLSFGTIDDVVVVQVQGQDMVLAAINISIESHDRNPRCLK